MADFGSTFDVNEVEEVSTGKPVPAGVYRVVCTRAVWKDSKKGGKFVECAFQILEGDYSQRLVWDRFNLVNSNPDTVAMARNSLRSFGKAVGLSKFRDSSELENIPLYVLVEIQPGKDGYGPSNRVVEYKSVKDAKTLVTAGGAMVVDSAKPTWM
jgi:hypothetical protein